MTHRRFPDNLVTNRHHLAMRHSLDRRCLLNLAAGLGAAATTARLGPGVAPHAVAHRQDVAPSHTWLLEAPDALRPDDPGAPPPTEIDELLTFQADRTDAMIETITNWDGRPAVFPWLELGMQLTAENLPPGLYETRAQALLRTAMHDAVVAALDAQAAHSRPSPVATDDRIAPVGNGSMMEASFPSLHAAVAGAASTVLAYLFPDASADGFVGMADEAATSRLWAGASYRSDIEAGLALGRAIGDLAVAHGEADGADAEWDGSGWPTGDGVYETTPPNHADPFLPLGGTWATWVLPSGDAIRPAPFPAYGSPGWQAELSTVRRAAERRTLEQERTIDYWLSVGPNGFYTSYAQDIIAREGLGEAEAASVLAMVSVAMYDGAVATWDGKYHYLGRAPAHGGPGDQPVHSQSALPIVSGGIPQCVWGRRGGAGRCLPGSRGRPADIRVGRFRPEGMGGHPLHPRQ